MNRFVVFLSLMFIGAFAAAGVQQKEMSSTQNMDVHMMKDCPMALPNTSLSTSDTPAGIAINITTEPKNILELRRRVEHMVAMHHLESSIDGIMKGQMLPGTVAYEPIDNGARLTLTPKDPERLPEFRTQVRVHLEQMKKGGCSMMQGMMSNMGMPKPEPKAAPKKDETDHSAHHPEEKP